MYNNSIKKSIKMCQLFEISFKCQLNEFFKMPFA